MKFALLLIFVALASARPQEYKKPHNSFLRVKVVRPGHNYEADVSRQRVHVLKTDVDGNTYAEDEPFTDHRPPFLNLPEVKPYDGPNYIKYPGTIN